MKLVATLFVVVVVATATATTATATAQWTSSLLDSNDADADADADADIDFAQSFAWDYAQRDDATTTTTTAKTAKTARTKTAAVAAATTTTTTTAATASAAAAAIVWPRKPQATDNVFYELWDTDAEYGVHDVLVCFGGCGASRAASVAWCKALAQRTRALALLTFGHVVGVAGPSACDYSGAEIPNTALAQLVHPLATRTTGSRVLVVAHSSGTFVANEFFLRIYEHFGAQVAGTGASRVAHGASIDYFNLDGESGVQFRTPRLHTSTTPETYAVVRRAYAVAAHALGCGHSVWSHNHHDMTTFAASVPFAARRFVVHSSLACCRSTWCAHDVVVTMAPHNADTYDLGHDYAVHDAHHPVTTQYLEFFLAGH